MCVNQEAEVVGRYTTVLEQMTAGAAVRVSQPSLGDLEYRRCQTAGCQFYALQQHNWKCSRCYVNESNSSQSASSTAGHVQQLTSHTTAQPLLQEHEPRWNGTSVIVSLGPRHTARHCRRQATIRLYLSLL